MFRWTKLHAYILALLELLMGNNLHGHACMRTGDVSVAVCKYADQGRFRRECLYVGLAKRPALPRGLATLLDTIRTFPLIVEEHRRPRKGGKNSKKIREKFKHESLGNW